MRYLKLSAIFFAAMIMASCRPAIQRNILSGMDPDSKEYKKKLADEINDHKPGELAYTFNKYVSVKGQDYIDISIDGRGIHANSLVLVKDWSKLEGIKQTKGVGYSGAELKNLKLALINPDTDNPVFVYEGVDQIVD